MAWSTPLDAEIPVILSRADYDRTRRQFFLVTGAARDEVHLPKLAPPGVRIERRVTAIDRPPMYGFGSQFSVDPDVNYSRSLNVGVFATSPPGFGEFLGVVSRPSFESPLVLPDGSAIHFDEPASDRAVGDDDAWYGTPFGREMVTFTSPFVQGQYGWEPAAAHALPRGALVLVRWPHPFIVGMRPPLFTGSFVTHSGICDGCFVFPRRYGVFASSVILTGIGDRQEPRPFDFQDDAGVHHRVWAGFYEDEASVSDFAQALSFVARNAALQAVVTAAAAALTYGAAIPAVAGAIAAAENAFAGVAIPTISTADLVVAGATVSAAKPEEVNAALAEVAEVTPYIDLVPFVGELADLSFTELVIRAQTTRKKQDDLRLELAQARQSIVGQPWFGPLKEAVSVIASAIIAIVAGPEMLALERAIMALTKLVVSAATMGEKLIQGKELASAAARAADERGAAQLVPLTEEEAALLAEADDLVRQIADLEREVGHAPAPPSAPAPAPAPAPPPGMFARLAAGWRGLSTGQKVAGGLALALGGALAVSIKPKR